MEQAIQYNEYMDKFKATLEAAQSPAIVNVVDGRRFDRVVVNGNPAYFVDRHTWEIYGAKSSFQYNPRRWYGKLNQAHEFDWKTKEPVAGTALEAEWNKREHGIKQNYRPRGRPRKVTT